MKILLAATLALFATAYSVANIKRVADNVYTADANVVTGKNVPLSGVPAHETITTTGCEHTPGQGASAIIVTTDAGTRILFSDGSTCTVVGIN